MKIQIEDTEWQELKDRLARVEALLPARVVGGSAFAVVMNAMREVFEVDPRLICSQNRTVHVLKPKWCAIWILHEVFHKTHCEIRDMLRHKNHSFITHAMRTFAEWRKEDKEYDQMCRMACEMCLRQTRVYLNAA